MLKMHLQFAASQLLHHWIDIYENSACGWIHSCKTGSNRTVLTPLTPSAGSLHFFCLRLQVVGQVEEDRSVHSTLFAVAQLSFSFHPYVPFFHLAPPLFLQPTCQGEEKKTKNKTRLSNPCARVTAKLNLRCYFYKRTAQTGILMGRNSLSTRNTCPQNSSKTFTGTDSSGSINVNTQTHQKRLLSGHFHYSAMHPSIYPWPQKMYKHVWLFKLNRIRTSGGVPHHTHAQS